MPAHETSALTSHLCNEAATEACGAALAAALQPGLVIWLEGDLGAGKTTLTRGLLRALGHQGSVKSPTYTLLEVYAVSRMSLYHFDFYRFAHPDEFLESGLEEYFGTPAVCLVEWADKAAPHVPQPDLLVRLAVAGEGRSVSIEARSPRGQACLSSIGPI
ncbi:MAG: tRNA (adenosine(37)-N6)-threonylcarbamoyltransferase complex ATPase subunit type 1 TsaE [Candidatus Dactylopiibacterium carminicum]|uniref:tRNA threonylcarbamoyladenosine biosynthesis protein TsaE n=1 Tax=Candidatus Dactylopiibacterium carminicum TaxID=857335 RepID=A0A272ET36_9RHOO|nr:tRNA (adenosine(37)-N6)-threonylcarbamoyltransferase complex ATPase subunit type 1 TsaE [Candidatus Dactylopiibacterium carminicum]KAF7599180.1 tRNA (adenosine(37)-N6)-threonylcarbamoyltransferase complex ATPase subunit type 1 TsaE [Candidatus Dactylopiibacterium carminicum]PAS93274.1 MAG: tRNA (adenosine(37)-N6)-threonylcarbamoyltransferase complex ATPase subunit type 1 TsaE [Candidatus Dactylopiibacterium carminicum]PAS97116.1 MAG: tRNA (adenosine(37)-N6)-threonylcarbamoyltransferase comple